MPNADHYRAAALRLRRSSAQVRHDTRVLLGADDPAGLVGGPVRSRLVRSLGTVEVSALRAADELDRLASICDRRAEICLGHAAQLVRHAVLAATLGSAAPPPAPPAWWVEV